MTAPWEETWVHDARDERYVVLEPDGPALARAVLVLLEHQCDGTGCPVCEKAKSALRQGGVPLE